jgi:hypothetical protein
VIAEGWLALKKPWPGVDLLRCHQLKEPVPEFPSAEFWTLEVDLRREDKEIFSAFDKGARYEIRRAASKDDIEYLFEPLQRWGEQAEQFVKFYGDFSSVHAAAPLNVPRFRAYVESGSLRISSIRSRLHGTLVMHCYLVLSDRARLLFSASKPRRGASSVESSLIGRANRFCHWRDIQEFQHLGCERYDFGGWAPQSGGTSALDGIHRFKKEFGGEPVKYFFCEQPITVMGRLYVRVRDLYLNRVRRTAGAP